MKRSDKIKDILKPVIEEELPGFKVGEVKRCSWVDGAFKWTATLIDPYGQRYHKEVGCYWSMIAVIRACKNGVPYLTLPISTGDYILKAIHHDIEHYLS